MLLYGVDFSGASDGGRGKIRVVRRDLDRPGCVIDGATRCDRRELRERIAASREPSLWRIDAPFSLPLATLERHGFASERSEWIEVARWMQRFGSPRGLRTALRDLDRREPRRTCDRAAATPMAPMNLRVFKQTWTVMVEVLLPLAEAGLAVEPVHRATADSRTVICEGCPATVLRDLGRVPRGYKGRGPGPAAERGAIVDSLRQAARGAFEIPSVLVEEAIADEEGDLLDALLLVRDPWCGPPPAEARLEAWVY